MKDGDHALVCCICRAEWAIERRPGTEGIRTWTLVIPGDDSLLEHAQKCHEATFVVVNGVGRR